MSVASAHSRPTGPAQITRLGHRGGNAGHTRPLPRPGPHGDPVRILDRRFRAAERGPSQCRVSFPAGEAVVLLSSCGGRGVADWQPDGPVAEIGHKIQPAAESLDIAGDDLEGGDLAVFDLGHRATLTPWWQRSASDPGPAVCGSPRVGARVPVRATGARPPSISSRERRGLRRHAALGVPTRRLPNVTSTRAGHALEGSAPRPVSFQPYYGINRDTMMAWR